MRLKELSRVWFKYQLSLSWQNILFRYFVKLVLFINLALLLVTLTYKYKAMISQFQYLVAGLVITDLLLKYKLLKKRQDIKAFHVAPNGVSFLAVLNVLQDIISLRNLILPALTLMIVFIIDQQSGLSFLHLLAISCLANIVAGIVVKRIKYFALIITSVLILMTVIFHLNIVIICLSLTIALLLVIYLRYGERTYPKHNTISISTFNSFYGIGNPFLWLEFVILKKSRPYQLAFVRLISVCALYGYLIEVTYPRELDQGFSLVLLIQIYYSLVPMMLIAYILSASHSYLSLLMTIPNLKDFFITKLNFILLFQLSLTLILCILNYSDFQAVYMISSISIFNIFLVTPMMFMGVLLADEKVDIFDSSMSNYFFISSFVQSLYFMFVMACSGLILYTAQSISPDNFSSILVGLGVIGFFQKERFISFFISRYYKMKYNLFNKLS